MRCPDWGWPGFLGETGFDRWQLKRRGYGSKAWFSTPRTPRRRRGRLTEDKPRCLKNLQNSMMQRSIRSPPQKEHADNVEGPSVSPLRFKCCMNSPQFQPMSCDVVVKMPVSDADHLVDIQLKFFIEQERPRPIQARQFSDPLRLCVFAFQVFFLCLVVGQGD